MSTAESSLLIRGIGRLLTMGEGGSAAPIADAAVVISGGRIRYAGPVASLPGGLVRQASHDPSYVEIDAGGACVIPGFVDAHTHLVWAGSRRAEFEARMAGVGYDGGGIRTTVEATRAASDQELLDLAVTRGRAMVRTGTTTVEIKSGYGLTPTDELRLLNIATQVGEVLPLRVEVTYLGAHVVPAGRDRADYVREVIDTVPAAAQAGAGWCDVFCDEGVFTVAESRAILMAARDAGLGLRIHAEEIAPSGGAALAAELGCASADHLEHVTARDAADMARVGVVAVLLPTVTLSLRTGAFGQASVLRDAGVELALATDCNPGTSWCESMPTAIRLACLAQGLSVTEAFRAATLGSAQSLRRADIGHLSPDARGDVAILDAEHEADLVAHLGSPGVRSTIVGGEVVFAVA